MKKILAVLAVPPLPARERLRPRAMPWRSIAITTITTAARVSALLGGLAAGAIIGGAIASSRPGYAYRAGLLCAGLRPRSGRVL